MLSVNAANASYKRYKACGMPLFSPYPGKAPKSSFFLLEPVTISVYIYQRKSETLSPNSMQNRFRADFQF